MVMTHRILAAAAACYLILNVSQRRMTRMPFPEIKTTCHDMNGCSVSNKVRAVFGILTVTAKSVKASQNEAFAARIATVSIMSGTLRWEDTAQAVLRPCSKACTAARQTMSHTRRCNRLCGGRASHIAEHGIREPAGNKPKIKSWLSISRRTATATGHDQK